MPDYNPKTASSLVELVRVNLPKPIDVKSRLKKRELLLQSIKQKTIENKLGEVIQLVTELRDFDNGIDWININKSGKGLNVLIRDARKVNISTSNKYYGHLMMAINHVRAAKTLLEISGKDKEELGIDVCAK
jgi:hypothetical protein